MNKILKMERVQNMLQRICLIFTGLVMVTFPNNATAQEPSELFNRIVVLIDASGSYKGRQAEAVKRVDSLLSAMTERRVKRWAQDDEIFIVSLDAIPEVIWHGGIKELKGLTSSAWQRRFRARSDFAGCTDVNAGFLIAAKLFGATPIPSDKYLMVFSDLKDEPPTTSPHKCKAPQRPSPPSKDFPWDQLADVSMTVYWMPPTQKFAWKKAIEQQGLADSFKLYSTSESAEIPLSPPHKAEVKITEEDQAQMREGLYKTGENLLLYGGLIIIIVVVVPGIVMIAIRRFRRPGGRAGNGAVRVTGTVRPLPISRLRQNQVANQRVARPRPNQNNRRED